MPYEQTYKTLSLLVSVKCEISNFMDYRVQPPDLAFPQVNRMHNNVYNNVIELNLIYLFIFVHVIYSTF